VIVVSSSNYGSYHEGVWGDLRHSSTHFEPRQQVEVSGKLHTLQIFTPAPPSKEPLLPIGWAPEPVWSICRREESAVLRGTESPLTVIQPVACPLYWQLSQLIYLPIATNNYLRLGRMCYLCWVFRESVQTVYRTLVALAILRDPDS
jgi:hypothetical protein